MVSERITSIIHFKLYRDLAHVEIIPYGNSIWFIDRETKQWYLELQKSGNLFYFQHFFDKFFLLFGLELEEYQRILSGWVEDVLNCGVRTAGADAQRELPPVEDVLNCGVRTAKHLTNIAVFWVEDVLNHKVSKTQALSESTRLWVEDVLNHKVSKT